MGNPFDVGAQMITYLILQLGFYFLGVTAYRSDRFGLAIVFYLLALFFALATIGKIAETKAAKKKAPPKPTKPPEDDPVDWF